MKPSRRLYLSGVHGFLTAEDLSNLEDVKKSSQESAASAAESRTYAQLSATAAAESESKAKGYSESIDPAKIDATIALKADNLYFDPDTNLLYLTSNGEIIGDGVTVATSGGSGGGGGSSNNAVLTVQNTTGWLYKNISQSANCKLSFTWSSIEDGLSTGAGVVTVKVGGVVRHSASVDQGPVELDVTTYLTSGSNVMRVTVTDVYGNARSLTFTVNMISLTLTSSFDATVAYTGSITFPYVPTGNAEKTVHFILDGKEIGKVVTSVSGRQQSFIIPAQPHGSHTFRVYFEAAIDGEAVESNELYYDLICLESGNTAPVIVSSFRGTNVEQFVTFAVPYAVYNPLGLTSDVTLYVNDVEITSLTVDRTTQSWSYRPDVAGEMVMTIVCTNSSGVTTRKNIVITVAESQIQVDATTEDLKLYLTAYGRSNNEANPDTWVSGDISVGFSGFNFKTDGWQIDEEGATVMRVAGDARLTIPYHIFATDFRSTGKTIEIEFATRDVLNYDAVMLDCMSGGRGLQVTTQRATLVSEQSTIGTQYKEEEHVRLSFVVEKKSGNKLLLCYINGILSGSMQYPDDDDFSQTTPVGITIGSNDCITDIYCIRVYDNDLTRYQILDNWIADTQNGIERKERFERNNVYDDYGAITTDTLKKDLPYLVIVSPVLPTYKGDKKTCSGYYVDPIDATKSFTFEGAEIDVQGTSSQYYYKKNFKIKFKGGFTLHDGTASETYQINSAAYPTNTFTFKADVASSEGANNVVLAKIYNDLCPVKTPPQEEDPRVRQTIDGHPIVIFWDNGVDVRFYAKFNFNNDKGTEEVFGFSEGDESWEILQNGTERTGFRSADFSGTDWKNDFEARYPEDNVNTTNLAAFAEWLVSTNAEAATNEALMEAVAYDGVTYTIDSAEYRLAKFKMELADHANVDAMVFYYVITELFLCIDQREKNAFPTLWKDDPNHWMMLFYDADSSLGIDNKGNLAFDYYLEDIDYTEAGDPIFNGQASVLWVNLRKCFYDNILEEYTRLRTTLRGDGSSNPLLSYDVVNGLFEAHQGKWSEAIYNEDGYSKSIEPYVLNGDTLYLPMLQGKKEQQRKWWLYNRFRYLDSKYNTGSSMETRITMRAHAQGNIKMTAYVNMYGHVYYNAEMAEHRMVRGREYEFVWAATGAEDAVIGINDADMITSLGDLSPLMLELADISKATHLTSLKIGDASDTYKNLNLNSITLGNNVLLRSIDLRNCSALTQPVNASGCTGLEEAYFDGTSVTSVSLPNGGSLKILHLPETVTNLTLRNQTALSEFVMPSYANVTTLWLENNSSVIDPLAILNTIPASSRVRIIGLVMHANTSDDIFSLVDKLDTMRGLDENGNNTDLAQVSGKIYIDMISEPALEAISEFQKRYPSLIVYYNRKETYTVRFYCDGVLLQTVPGVKWNTNVTYTGDIPVREPASVMENWEFTGWSPEPVNVTVDMDCHAQFKNTIAVARFIVDRRIVGEYENERVTSIGSNVFRNCTNLTSVNFPNVTTIGNAAFQDCANLTSINFPNVTTIGPEAFNGCAITSANLPNVVELRDSALAGIRVKALVLPKLEKTVNNSFYAAYSIESIDLPSIKQLGYRTFEYCSVLRTLIIRRDDVICILDGTRAFNNTPIGSGTGYIYVPSALIEDYKVATNWSTFADQLRALEDYTVDGTITGELDETKI